MKKQLIHQIFVFLLILVGIQGYGQTVTKSRTLNKPITVSTTVEATEEISMLPGFYVNGSRTPFMARIVKSSEGSIVKGSPYNGNEYLNWVASTSYDFSGNMTSSGVSYFNSLGKSTQSHALDIKTGQIWVNETRYDAFDRPVFSTLSAPVGTAYGYKGNFVQTNSGSVVSKADIENIKDNAAVSIIGKQENTLGWYYSDRNTREPYQDITDYPFSKAIYSSLTPGSVLKVLGGNKVKKTASASPEWIQSYSFRMPMTQEVFYEFGKEYFPERPVAANPLPTGKPYRDPTNSNTSYRYTLQKACSEREAEYFGIDRGIVLEVGKVYYMSVPKRVSSTFPYYKAEKGYFRVLSQEGEDTSEVESGGGTSGNLDFTKIKPKATVLDYDYAYECPLGRPFYIKGEKTVVRDVHGVESVVFKDGNGNVIAAARSGNEDDPNRAKRPVISAVGKQGFVDFHIPVGCGGKVSIIGLTGKSVSYKIYDLITEAVVVAGTSRSINLASGMYRLSLEGQVSYNPLFPYATFTGANKENLALLDPKNTLAIAYHVNYYDYSLNYYDKANRLIKSTQPLSKNLATTFNYNSLGQLLSTSSPDEGESQFKYRKDGQIRFSQNSKQKANNEFSYTNYDVLGRPVESGVASGDFNSLNPDVLSFAGSRKEQNFTVYDKADPELKTILSSAEYGLNAEKYKQTFVAGSVSKTYTQNPNTSTTWYGYDIYGRVKWMIQKIAGLPRVKSIDYEYDFAKGQVTKVTYQKYHKPQRDVISEYFEHQYTYDVTGQLVKVATSTDGIKYTEQAKYHYYETGALKRVEVAENVQGIDYIYNMNGQLKAINHPSRDSNLDPGKDGLNGMPKDLFGFAIDYYNGDYLRGNTPTPVTSTSDFYGKNQFNGNIKATRWSSQLIANGSQAAQVFSYNKNNWLLEANFGSASNSGAITANINQEYRVYGLSYDANGNLKTLNRNMQGAKNSNAMDRLSYKYYNGVSNRLEYVDDVKYAGVGDIKDQNSGNYVYNSIGQLIENKADGVKYEYTASGLVSKVFAQNKLKVVFFYNDRGHRVKKISYNTNTGAIEKQTVYVMDASGSSMAIITPAIGIVTKERVEQPIYGASRLGVYFPQNGSSVYQLSDHLGNVRATVLKAKDGSVLTAESSATDYYPFGMPMPNRQIINGEPYRYSYQGQEKDPETGKEAFQLRLWDGRIGRWLSPDPMGIHHTPYQGMANNPIIFVDPDGGYPTPYEAAVLAAHVYGGTNISLVGGWKLSKKIDFNRNSKSGLKGNLYERKLKNGRTEYAYVFAGTEDGDDWDDNIKQALGNSEQYSQAMEVSNALSVFYKQKELTFVGHSLGGGLANYSSLATNRSSITFNPAWVSKASVKKINKAGNRAGIQRNNYIHESDPLHIFQNASPAVDLLFKKIGNDHFVNGGWFSNIITGHFIGTMINRLEKNGNNYTKIPYKEVMGRRPSHY
ncbi:hypothetical protein TPENAI_60800 [Tenacibaculum litopenaei]|uniref:RHS repeat domain-containing protein n=1 Tax=Tenacibaculum litopenaei TaxID=396016 RepID=UPI0038949C44